jgi:hypothetical protein
MHQALKQQPLLNYGMHGQVYHTLIIIISVAFGRGQTTRQPVIIFAIIIVQGPFLLSQQ